jgi:ribonucleoside-diphosphate reductase beta chain
MLRELVRSDPDFAKISKDTEEECVEMFNVAIKQEKDWAKYLFEKGSMVGLNENILCDYVDYIGKQRMKAVNLPCDIEITQNPLPWTLKWIGGKEMQPAPQETNVTSYRVGGLNTTVDKDALNKFSL